MKPTTTVIVTRPPAPAARTAGALRQAGYATYALPLLDTIAITSGPKPRDLAFAAAADWWIFTSRAAVTFGLDRLEGSPRRGIAAVGAGTARELEQASWTVTARPEQQDSAGLLSLPVFSAEQIRRQSVAVVSGVGGRRAILTGLRQRGAQVRKLAVYRRVMRPVNAAQLANMPQDNTVVLLTSGSALRYWQRLAMAHKQPQMLALRLLVPSSRLCKLAGQLGFRRRALVLPQMSDTGIIEALHEQGL